MRSVLFADWLRNLPSPFREAVTSLGVLEQQYLRGITADSRFVQEGWIFVAVRGTVVDGHRYIESVCTRRPLLVVGENPEDQIFPDYNESTVPYLKVLSSAEAFGVFAAAFFGNPTQALKVIGITGTSGKTTTSLIVQAMLQRLGKPVGLIGTIEVQTGGRIVPATHTTPGPMELQGFFKEMLENECEWVVMEVSSHALKQQRVSGVLFDGMGFLNLSPEHLDYHPDMEDYFYSKALLFTRERTRAVEFGKNPISVVQVDSDYGARLYQELCAAIGPDLTDVKGCSAQQLEVSASGIRGEVMVGKESVPIVSPLIGSFNAQNLSLAVSLGFVLGMPLSVIQQGLGDFYRVPGRMEKVHVPHFKGPQVIVDYAHKPDALKKVLETLRVLMPKSPSEACRLITVFGCGGDRDKTKRPVMGRIAHALSDWTIVTSDNPRTERPDQIIQEIVNGIEAGAVTASGSSSNQVGKFEIIADRKMAIEKAIRMAKSGDWVLIAGKGHECYQLLPDPTRPGNVYSIPFDDREIARNTMVSMQY